MKRQRKKLVLAKETVRNLESDDLRGIAGAVTTEACIGNTQWYRCFGTLGCPTVTTVDQQQ